MEQNAAISLTASRGYIMETGKMILTGKAEDLFRDEQVKKAYLGL